MMEVSPNTPERPLAVVIAEDDVLLRMVAVEAFEDEGFVTFQAQNAAAALRIFKARPADIDVLFTDIRMPGGMDGLELAHRVRERWPSTGIVIVSGNIFVATDELPEGARFLPKPYDLDRVVEFVRLVRPPAG